MSKIMDLNIVDVINTTRSQITVEKKGVGGFSKPIDAGRSEEYNSHFSELIFSFSPGQRVVFKFIKREGFHNHIDVEVGDPDTV